MDYSTPPGAASALQWVQAPDGGWLHLLTFANCEGNFTLPPFATYSVAAGDTLDGAPISATPPLPPQPPLSDAELRRIRAFLSTLPTV